MIKPKNEEMLTKRFITDLKPDNYDSLENIVEAVFSKAIEAEHSSYIFAKVQRILN